MGRALKCLLIMSVLLGAAVPARAAEDRALERGVAVIDLGNPAQAPKVRYQGKPVLTVHD